MIDFTRKVVYPPGRFYSANVERSDRHWRDYLSDVRAYNVDTLKAARSGSLPGLAVPLRDISVPT